MSKVIIIGGPTASGKSGLALEVAEKLSGCVINADSMQLYDGLPLLTAQPSAKDKARAPHLLYGALSPHDPCSAARWRDMALGEIEKAHAAGQTPVVTGGTGFYLKTLTHGISPMPDVPREFRDRAAALQREMGNPAFHEELKKRDPKTAARLDPFNTQRNVRAWEVLEATGRGLAVWQDEPPEKPPAHLKFVTVTLLPPREALYRRCDARLDAMVAQGALGEVAAFGAPGDSPLGKALGRAAFAAHLAGETTLEEALAEAKQETRRYARRQITWFRHQIRADLVLGDADAGKVLELAGV